MTAITIPTELRKDYFNRVGEALVDAHGKRNFYSPEEVKTASAHASASSPKLKFIDWHCWAMCVFCTRPAFDAYHEATGEVCDYGAMKAEMTAAVLGDGAGADIDDETSWLDWSGGDLSSILDWFIP